MLFFLILFLTNCSCYCVSFKHFLNQPAFRYYDGGSNPTKLKRLGEHTHSSDSAELPKISRNLVDNDKKDKTRRAPYKKKLLNHVKELQSDETFQIIGLKQKHDMDKDDDNGAANTKPAKPKNTGSIKQQRMLQKKQQYSVIKIDSMMPDIADFELKEENERGSKNNKRVWWFFNQIDWEPFEFSKEG